MSGIYEFCAAAYPWVLIGTTLAVAMKVINVCRKRADCGK